MTSLDFKQRAILMVATLVIALIPTLALDYLTQAPDWAVCAFFYLLLCVEGSELRRQYDVRIARGVA